MLPVFLFGALLSCRCNSSDDEDDKDQKNDSSERLLEELKDLEKKILDIGLGNKLNPKASSSNLYLKVKNKPEKALRKRHSQHLESPYTVSSVVNTNKGWSRLSDSSTSTTGAKGPGSTEKSDLSNLPSPDEPQSPQSGAWGPHHPWRHSMGPGPFSYHAGYPPYGASGAENIYPPPTQPRVHTPACPFTPNQPETTMYRDLTPLLVDIVIDTKDGERAYKSDFFESTGDYGRRCYVFTPRKGHVYSEVRHKGRTVWIATNNCRCTQATLCNIGFSNKKMILEFTDGTQGVYKKKNDEWTRKE